MTTDSIYQQLDTALNQLSDALSRGDSAAMTNYLAMLARFHRYSFGNTLLIAMARPDATLVAGFHRWRELGRHVRKGEKGIAIMAPMMLKEPGQRDDEGQNASDNKPVKRHLRFRTVYVFDVSQTDGELLADRSQPSGNPGDATRMLQAAIRAQGIVVDYDDVPFGADGVSRGGRISLREHLPPATEFSVLVHEYAHELLHKGEDRPVAKTLRETEAEAVAFVVCQAIGIDSTDASADYIRHYDGKPETLRASLDRIQRTAATILVAVHGEERNCMPDGSTELATAEPAIDGCVPPHLIRCHPSR